MAIFITYIFWSVLQQQSDLAHCCWSLKGDNRRLKRYWHQLQFTLDSDGNNSFGKRLFLKTTEKKNIVCLAAVEIKSTPPKKKDQQQCHEITRTSATSAVAVVAESINASV